MQLRYVGPVKQQYVLSLPVPFVSLSDRLGDVVFTEANQWIADVPEEYVEYLLDDEHCGGVFEPVETEEGEPAPPKADRMNEKLEKACAKRFTGKVGKWHAKAYVKKQKLEGLVELVKNAYGQWTLVRPDASVAPAAPISTDVEGQGVTSDDSDRIEASVGA